MYRNAHGASSTGAAGGRGRWWRLDEVEWELRERSNVTPAVVSRRGAATLDDKELESVEYQAALMNSCLPAGSD